MITASVMKDLMFDCILWTVWRVHDELKNSEGNYIDQSVSQID